ncbi:MAG: tandem-95 repeat protein [Arcobacter sp.]|uniref:tandem-95 repeat protein n=1 Tax=Arcobacter sp. TaxID=1872629 RepID=UPI003C70A3A7
MAKLVGVIEGGTNGTPLAGIQVIGTDGVKREVKVGDYIYEGENIVSTNPQASVEVKYLALSKVVTYDGVFNILVDNSVSSQSDETENSLGQDIIPIENNNSAIVTNQTSQMWNDTSFSVSNTTYEQNYNNSERNDNNNFENNEFVNEIKDKEPENTSLENIKIPFKITSSNTAIFNEDEEGVVLKITANESIGVKYGIENSLDGALFTIDSTTGELSFLNSPDYDTPLDTDFDNEYNLNIIAIDNEGNSKTQLVSVYINNINDAPVAVADSDTTNENQLLTLDVLANDTDADSSDFTLNNVSISTNTHSAGYDDSKVTTNASVSVVNNKLVFNLGDEFDYLSTSETATVVVSYEMQDEGGLISTTTSTITITGTNDTPIAVADIATVTENGSLTIDVLANDTDIDSSNFSLNSASISTNTHSTRYDDSSVTTHATVLVVDNKLVFNQGDEFDYLSVGETATVVVSYEMQDEGGLSSTATSTITITGTNDAPVAVADNLNNHYVDLSNTTTSNITVADSSTINLDRKDNFSISVSVEGADNENSRNVIFAKGDAFSLRIGPKSNELIFSMATEKYSVVEHSDGTIGFTTETINVGDVFFDTGITYNVNSVNNITFSYDGKNVTITNTDENGNTSSNSIAYSGTVIDPDYLNNNLTIGNGPIISSGIAGETWDYESSVDANIDNLSMIVENKEVLNTNFENGLTDSYGHTITLGDGATLEYQDKNEDTPLVIKAETLLANDTDIDGDTLSIISVQASTHGTVALSADGSTITFTPDTNYSGHASFTYTISDGNGTTSTASANFDITSVNDAPVAIGEVITKIADERSYTISPPITRSFTYLGSETLTSNINDFDTDNSRHATYNSNILVLDDNLYYSYTNSAGGTAVDLFYPTGALNTTAHDDGDDAATIDSLGYYNEGVIFDFAREVDSIIVKIDPTSQITDDDNVEVRVYSDTSNTLYWLANFNESTQTYSISNNHTGYGIKRIAIFAKDAADGGQTEFRIQSVTGTYTETKTLDVFTIDKDILLTNDTDVDSNSLSLKLGNGILYDSSNVAIGTVSLNDQGDITVTPNAHFDATDFSYPKTHISTHFSYSVVDGDGGESSLVDAIVNVKVGTDTSDGVTFTQGDPVVTLEGTTITTKPVDTIIIGTDAKDTFSINGTIDLSNVSSIEGIELNKSTANLIGSGVDGAITLNDVISATDSSNDLIINASDHNASDQITVDSSFTKKEAPVTQDGSVYDLYYGSNGTTLLVEIHQEIV